MAADHAIVAYNMKNPEDNTPGFFLPYPWFSSLLLQALNPLSEENSFHHTETEFYRKKYFFKYLYNLIKLPTFAL